MRKNRFLMYSFASAIVCLLLLFGCKKDDNTLPRSELPVIITAPVGYITHIAASCGGKIISEGKTSVIEFGLYWSENQNPGVTDNKKLITGSMNFTCNLTGLSANTTYYVRAFARNNSGTAYSNIQSFTTRQSNASVVADVDGNLYNAVTIGTQTWMAENLKASSYRNGNKIETTIPGDLDLEFENTPDYQWPSQGEECEVSVYGRLYTWYAATDDRGVCPTGWHIPSDAEWQILADYLGGFGTAGGKLKETDTLHWKSPNAGATNETGFTALPGGARDWHGQFINVGEYGYWWSSSENFPGSAWGRQLSYFDGALYRQEYFEEHGFSIRCIKD